MLSSIEWQEHVAADLKTPHTKRQQQLAADLEQDEHEGELEDE